MLINIPELSVVVLIGRVTQEKLEFSQKHFGVEEILASRNFEIDLAQRLEEGKLTVIELSELEEKRNIEIIRLAKKYHCPPIAIMIHAKETEYYIRKKKVSEKDLAEHLREIGYQKVFVLEDEGAIKNAEVQRTKLANNKKEVHGPFDIIGDIHGCYDELCELLEKLGYEVDKVGARAYNKQDRKAVFLGDLVDRGPNSPQVLRLVMSMVKEGAAYCVLGNHDGKLLRKLKGANVQVIHGLETTLEQLEHEPKAFIEEVITFLEGLVSHYVFDEGRLVVVHAGLKEKLHGRESKRIRDLAMYGETTGEKDEYGLPVRLNWSRDYSGNAWVVYGHTPRLHANIINHTINIDTGCVFGGKLTAFRYPEKEIVEVQAKARYYDSPKPLS